MINIPPRMLKRMETMTEEQRKEVIAYFKRNDEEEIRLAGGAKNPPVDSIIPPPSTEIPETLRRPSTKPNEYIKKPDAVGDYVEDVYSDVLKDNKDVVSTVLKTEAKNRGLNTSDVTRLMQFANDVAEVESENIVDRTQNDKADGIGRGKYQFERTGSKTAKTAANRFFNWEKENNISLDIPKKDREELKKDAPDFSKLSEDTQDSVFYIHHSKHPRTPFTEIAKGKYDPKEAWINFHWSGNPENKASKEKLWNARIQGGLKNQLALAANTFVNAI